MAKRKRLAPAQPRDLDTPLETKSIAGLSPHPAPPIASVAGDASTTAALEELSETLRRARAEGRMITEVPLTQIEQSYLVRDRIAVDDEDMEALRASLKARGQQTPIEVVELGKDRFGLISGWRRLQALHAIGADTAKAIITAPRDAPEAYVAMIEENEIRVGHRHNVGTCLAIGVRVNARPHQGAHLHRVAANNAGGVGDHARGGHDF